MSTTIKVGISGVVVAIVAACSSADGPIASSSDALIVIGQNNPVVMMNMHEVAVAPGKDPTTNTWHWVAAFNNFSDPNGPSSGYNASFSDLQNLVGWSLSNDLTAASWTSMMPPNGSEETWWVPPPPATCTGGFLGWRGDTTIAPIGNPPDGTQLMIANLTTCTNLPGNPGDVATLVSTNGGSSWGMPSYVTGGPADPSHTGGGDVDQPRIASNPMPPYSTFIGWQNNSNNPPSTGWITSVNNQTFQANSSSSVPMWWNTNTATGCQNCPKAVNNTLNNSAYRPKLAVGTYNCSPGDPHELVYVAWSDALEGRRCLSPTTSQVAWSLTVFDNTLNEWLPSGGIAVDVDQSWPNCIAMGGGIGPADINANVVDPYLATNGQYVAVAHNHSTPIGTRIAVNSYQVGCSGGHITALAPIGVFQSPDWCYGGGVNGWCPPPPGNNGGHNGVGGTNVVNDQWGAQIAFLQKGSVPELAVTWYDTSGDPSNKSVRVRAALSTNGFIASPFFTGTTYNIRDISNVSGIGQNLPWPIINAPWFDYQALAVDYIGQTFLAAWGGDDRTYSSSGPAGIWAATISY